MTSVLCCDDNRILSIPERCLKAFSDVVRQWFQTLRLTRIGLRVNLFVGGEERIDVGHGHPPPSIESDVEEDDG